MARLFVLLVLVAAQHAAAMQLSSALKPSSPLSSSMHPMPSLMMESHGRKLRVNAQFDAMRTMARAGAAAIFLDGLRAMMNPALRMNFLSSAYTLLACTVVSISMYGRGHEWIMGKWKAAIPGSWQTFAQPLAAITSQRASSLSMDAIHGFGRRVCPAMSFGASNMITPLAAEIFLFSAFVSRLLEPTTLVPSKLAHAVTQESLQNNAIAAACGESSQSYSFSRKHVGTKKPSR
ncbi:hypothetical protein GUITHDRAFT_136913 [Guillardia theta CCMP2712]|uniref:Uncharacterized protein n=1 Tax=Guillardia theta (strain CCMP2712) TaxID=905079 RepID=L1JIS3_GUITC|nr:hypothetical protein GUITHDRAFT_136913 [Guillardia theta CCMP2712]EKX48418.1 hypothetical protein GUITHDRAFT_136913 [Guillardia theta CCMP2712]|eukprot:XP_005835398.1 hypothetical protein GUITHDRAFT_136913 [Guillardia theta CCMP2712]